MCDYHPLCTIDHSSVSEFEKGYFAGQLAAIDRVLQLIENNRCETNPADCVGCLALDMLKSSIVLEFPKRSK